MQIVISIDKTSLTFEIDAWASLYDLIKIIHRQHSQYDINTYSYRGSQLNIDQLAQPLIELLEGEGLKNIKGSENIPLQNKNNLSKETLLTYEHTLIETKRRLEATRLKNRIFLSPLQSTTYHQALPHALREALPQYFPNSLTPLIASFVGRGDRFMVVDMVAALGYKEFCVGNAYVEEAQAVANEFYAYLALFLNKVFRPVLDDDGHIGLFVDVSAFPKLRHSLMSDPMPNSYFAEFAEAKASLRRPFATTSYSTSSSSCNFQNYECIIHYQLDGRVTGIYAPHSPEPFSKFDDLIHVNCLALAVSKQQLKITSEVLKASVAQSIIEKIVNKEGLKVAHPNKVTPVFIERRSLAYHLARASFLSCQNPGSQKQWNESNTLEEIVTDVDSPTGETKRTLALMLGQSEQSISIYYHEALLHAMLHHAQLQCLAIRFEKRSFKAYSALELLKDKLLEAFRTFKSEFKSTSREEFLQVAELERKLTVEIDIHQMIMNFFESCKPKPAFCKLVDTLFCRFMPRVAA